MYNKYKGKMSLCLKKYQAMKTDGGVQVHFHVFLISELHAPAALTGG